LAEDFRTRVRFPPPPPVINFLIFIEGRACAKGVQTDAYPGAVPLSFLFLPFFPARRTSRSSPPQQKLRQTMSETALKSWNHTEVRCLSGYRANERPLSFLVDRREIQVRAILKSWREPDFLLFKVETDDGRIYDLRHHEFDDAWQVRESAQRG